MIGLATLLGSMALATVAVTHKPWGKAPSGESVELYTLTNKNGLVVTISTYGATVVDLLVPDRNGKLGDISLGFDKLTPYFKQSPYFGSTIGRYGNRIANGRFKLDGREYLLAQNNGAHSLHGGKIGFDKRVWKATPRRGASVAFSLVSPDKEEGYPGTLNVQVVYTLTPDDSLKIEYKATTDKPTVVNLTNHTYFNLGGAGSGPVYDHRLRIEANQFTPVGPSLIPTGELRNVEGTPFDFRSPYSIGDRIMQTGGNPVGYDHNFVLKGGKTAKARMAARVSDPKSGRVMDVLTTEPGLQFYSGNFLDGSIIGKGGKAYGQHEAFCLETQHFPDSPNQAGFPSTVLRPGGVYRSVTVYKFWTQ